MPRGLLTFITLLSAGTIAVAASDDLAPATVVVAFGTAIALAVVELA